MRGDEEDGDNDVESGDMGEMRVIMTMGGETYRN